MPIQLFWGKSKFKILYVVFFIIAILLFMYCSFKKKHNRIFFTFDSVCSQKLQSIIKKHIHDELQLKGLGALSLKEIRESYPFVQCVSMFTLANDSVRFDIKLYKPLIYINDEAVLLSSGYCLSKDCMNKDILLLNTINVALHSPIRALPELAKNIHKIPQQLFNQYHISWQDHAKIVLHDTEKSLNIIADIDTISHQDKIQQCYRLHANEYALKQPFMVDIRFKNQIIVMDGKRGQYEKSFC